MIILNEAKPKYERLDNILESDLLNISFSSQVNIIIDLKEIIRKFFRPDINVGNYSQSLILEEVSSDILNTIGHYRNYFYKKGKYTNFFFLYSFEKSEISKKYDFYKKEYYEKYITGIEDDSKSDEAFRRNIARLSCKVVEKVSKFLPHVYFLDTSDFDELVYAKAIIENVPKNELIYILSNDLMLFQLVSENVRIINLKGIKSELITTENAVKKISKKEDIEISNNLIPLIFAISGVKKYSIPNIEGYGVIKTLKLLEGLKERGIVEDLPSIQIPIKFSELNSSVRGDKFLIDNKDIIIERFNLIRSDDIFAHNKVFLKTKLVMAKTVGSIQLFKDINSKTFTTFPLQLDMILKGEQI